MPLFSIITVTFNAEKYLEKSIESVINQNFNDFEYIIVDGLSSDNTIEIINKYKQRINTFISEKDHGIYDAMNKAINLATGDYLYFLGADDFLFEDNTLLKVANSIGDLKPQLIVGDVKYTSGKVFQSALGFKTLLHNTIHHQATFYHKSLYSDFRFDTNFTLIADYELNLIIYRRRKQMSIHHVNYTIALCTEGGVSRRQLQLANVETNAVRHKVLGTGSIFYQLVFNLKSYISQQLSKHN